MRKIVTITLLATLPLLAGGHKKQEKEPNIPKHILEKSRGVAWCSSYLIAVNAWMKCSGDIHGKASPYDLLHSGWRLTESIGGANKFIIVFTK